MYEAPKAVELKYKQEMTLVKDIQLWLCGSVLKDDVTLKRWFHSSAHAPPDAMTSKGGCYYERGTPPLYAKFFTFDNRDKVIYRPVSIR